MADHRDSYRCHSSSSLTVSRYPRGLDEYEEMFTCYYRDRQDPFGPFTNVATCERPDTPALCAAEFFVEPWLTQAEDPVSSTLLQHRFNDLPEAPTELYTFLSPPDTPERGSHNIRGTNSGRTTASYTRELCSRIRTPSTLQASARLQDKDAHRTYRRRSILHDKRPSQDDIGSITLERDRADRVPQIPLDFRLKRHRATTERTSRVTADESQPVDDFVMLDMSAGEGDYPSATSSRVPKALKSRPDLRSRAMRPRRRKRNLDCKKDLDTERNRASRFLHSPIDFARRQIRLIRIIPFGPSSPIRCEFILSLADDLSRPYTALSYTWGLVKEHTDVAKIILHGQDFWVRRNLWCFLHEARMNRSLCDNLFWIDALCIDQAGNGVKRFEEKNHQVNMMSDIYSNAREVICWLGEPCADKEVELKDLQVYLAAETSVEQEASALRGLRYLGNLEYWSRMWIVQEVVLAKQILLQCGSYSFHWSGLRELWDHHQYAATSCLKGVPASILTDVLVDPAVPKDLLFDPEGRRHWGDAYLILDWHINKPNRICYDILDALQDFQRQECSNPLDKVYGLLGLVTHKPVAVDYNKSTVELYEDLIRYALQYNMLVEDATESRGPGEWWICERSKCTNLLVLQNALNVSQHEVKEVYTRLALEIGIVWAAVHPFSQGCLFYRETLREDRSGCLP